MRGGIISVTRREFIRTGIASFASTTTLARGLESVVNAESVQTPPKRITFEEAFRNRRLIGSYAIQSLEDLFGAEEVKKYVANVFYDPESKLLKSRYGLTVDVADAMAVPTKNKEYASKKKSDLFIFSGALDSYATKIGKFYRTVTPTETSFKAQLAHEFVHIKDHFDGVTFEDGISIVLATYSKLSEPVLDFIKESRGYIRQIEYSRAAEKANPSDIVFGRFNKVPIGYLSSINDFTNKILKLENNLLPQKMSDVEIGYVTRQLNQIKSKIPEMGIVIPLRKLYQRFEKFGIK